VPRASGLTLLTGGGGMCLQTPPLFTGHSKALDLQLSHPSVLSEAGLYPACSGALNLSLGWAGLGRAGPGGRGKGCKAGLAPLLEANPPRGHGETSLPSDPIVSTSFSSLPFFLGDQEPSQAWREQRRLSSSSASGQWNPTSDWVRDLPWRSWGLGFGEMALRWG
jgi:hypothetical protein